MYRSMRKAILWLLPLAVTWGCTRVTTPEDSARQQPEVGIAPVNSCDLTAAANAYADSVMTRMTLEQMAGQLLLPATYTSADEVTLRKLLSYVVDNKVGGIAFHKGDVRSMRIIADTLNKRSVVPLFLAIDAENGLGMRLEGAQVYPLNYKLTDSSEQGMYDYGNAVGEECAAVGINMVFGPVLDVVPGPGWYLYKRSLGSDAQKVANLGIAYSRGLRDAGVMPVAKHFPGHGYTRTDPHVWLPIIERNSDDFRSIDLFPFSKYVEQGFPAIMAAHVAVPSLSGDSLPADFSEKILKDLLRTEMEFQGLIISDAVNMGAVKAMGNTEIPLPVMALLSGVDMILAPADTREAVTQIIDAVRSGLLPREVLRDRCHRVLFHKYLHFN